MLNGLIKTCKRLTKITLMFYFKSLNLRLEPSSSSGSRGVGRRRGLPGTGCRHSAFETDTRGHVDGRRLGTFSFV